MARRFGLLLWVLLALLAPAARAAEEPEAIKLRAWGVPSDFSAGPAALADLRVMEAFRAAHPHIVPVSTTGITIPYSSKTMDMVPFMQIAGDIAPDVLFVNFRQSHTYINMKLLLPLDEQVEALAGVEVRDGSALENDAYVAALSAGAGWEEMRRRVPPQCWPVMRRQCPYGAECRYREARDLPPLEQHWHVWSFPVGPLVIGLKYDRPLFAEHRQAGVEMRAPRDWNELLDWAIAMTDPPNNVFGLKLDPENFGWNFLSFLYSAGGEVVQQGPDGVWRCTLDTEAAVEAAWFFARLRWTPIERDGQTWYGVAAFGGAQGGSPVRYAMEFTYLDDRFLQSAEEQTKGLGPVPAGPDGTRGSEFNSLMLGIFSGLADEPARRQAAWEYIEFYDSRTARKIRTETLVDAGLGEFVRPYLLEQFNQDGRYDSLIRRASPELEETYRIAYASGIPEPYGKNCQYVYDQMKLPLGQILSDPVVQLAVRENNPELAKPVIRRILREGTEQINRRMLGNLPPPVERRREWIAWGVIALIVVTFAWAIRRTYLAFRPPGQIGRGGWQFARYRTAYLLAAPALLTIGMWMYYPMARGTTIAFQDYSVVGESAWTGASNFADVLFDPQFWNAVRVTIIYALLFFFFGFWVPIILAFLLSEVPRGKTAFRTIYYLPAVLSGLVVIFLWRSFYSPDGLVNEVLNGPIMLTNAVFGTDIDRFHQNWLESPHMALFFCLLPTVWAGMGPGCLIYLAALKTVPDEMYEAADIDGAGTWTKVRHVALPSIKALIIINFVGAMIGAVRGSGSFILAMTGGGPYGASGGATEVIGLKLFYTTFGYLQFGIGAAMAWLLGAMLIGFTVVQLQRLSNLEFRTAEKAG